MRYLLASPRWLLVSAYSAAVPVALTGLFGAGLLGAGLLSAGCGGGQSGAEQTLGPPGEPGPSEPGPDEPGPDEPGPNNPGAVECTLDNECRESALADLATLSAPQPQRFEVSSSSCQAYGVSLEDREVSGPACTCSFAGGGERLIGPVGLDCYATSRGGECLWSGAEFSGCSITDANACSSVCAEFAQRLEADAARSFQTDLVYAGCEQGNCRNVVSIDGKCYANGSYREGKSYDCSLGAPAILQAHALASLPPQRDALPNATTPFYLPGTDGTVQLSVYDDYWGTARGATGFGAYAQFFDLGGTDTLYGDVLDPLEGVDDCGVVQDTGGGAGARVTLLSVERAVLRDGEQEFPLEEFRSSSDSYYTYILDLAPGVQPRFGGAYGFSASGGTFGASVEIEGILLPEALSITELDQTSHFQRGALDLSWTGRGEAPLELRMDITRQIDDYNGAYHIDCLMADDGAFTLPAALLEAAPDGFVTATFRRARREVVSSGGKSLQTLAEVVVNHRFWLGPACDGSALMAACQRSAASVSATYAQCSDLEAPPLEQSCPDYLATTCGSCPEYFDCLAAATTCNSNGLEQLPGCGCQQ